MIPRRVIPPALILSGFGLLAVSVLSGSGHVQLFLVFPVFSGRGPAFLASVLLLMAGFFSLPFLLIGTDLPPVNPAEEHGLPEGRRELRSGAVIFIGPVPILLAGDSRVALYAMIAALVFLAFLLFLLCF
jgi:uncharacterized membrane protein